jgi:hypothetical protein
MGAAPHKPALGEWPMAVIDQTEAAYKRRLRRSIPLNGTSRGVP